MKPTIGVTLQFKITCAIPHTQMIAERYYSDEEIMETLLNTGDIVQTMYYEKTQHILIMFKDFSKCEILWSSFFNKPVSRITCEGIANNFDYSQILTNGNIPWQQFLLKIKDNL